MDHKRSGTAIKTPRLGFERPAGGYVKPESVRLFPGSINEENPSLPGRILQAADPAENDRTPRSDIILFSEL